MHFEKTMCDRLGYKYKDLFGHLEFILNKMNMVLNTHGNGLSDEELKMLNELFFKLETGQIEIIEFTRPIEKYFDVDEIYKENQQLKRNCNIGNENLDFYIKENQQLKNQLDYLRSGEYLNQLKFERNMLEDIVHNCEVSKEDKEFIDMTHRNTQLSEEKKQLKDKLKYWVDIYTDLKKWLEENESFDYCCNETTFTAILNKMQELEKESEKYE